MAARYWVGGTGTWDSSDTTHWATASGGGGGASVPGASDDVTFDAASGGGTVTVNTNFSINSLTGGAFTGTLDFSANNNSPTIATSFSFTGTGIRTLKLGSGTFTFTGSGTIWTTATATNLTLDAGTSTFLCTYSGVNSRLISASTPGNTFYKLSVSAGTGNFGHSDGITFNNNIDWTGFSGTWLNNSITIKGNLTLSSTMTNQAGANSMVWGGTGTQTITTNNVAFDRPIVMNGSGTYQLVGDLTTGASRTTTLTSGTLHLDNGATNYNFSTGLFSSSGTGVRNFTAVNSLIALSGTGTVWNTATVTNFTLSLGTSTIKMTDTSATAKTFSGGGKTYYDLWNAPAAGTASVTVVGSNTFHILKDDGSAAHSWLFTAGTTQTVSQWQIKGNAGALITIDSPTAATHALTLAGTGTVSTDYLSIKNSVASPTTSTWFAGANSTNVSGNTGWIFTQPTLHKSNFFLFF